MARRRLTQGDLGRPDIFKGEKLFAYNLEHYGERLREYRLKSGLNQPQLAKRIGITKNAIANWESGRVRPDINLIPNICETLGLSISEFFGIPSRMDDLSQKEQGLIKNYRAMPKQSQQAVDTLVDIIVENADREIRERCESGFEFMRHGDLRASAGTGYDLSDDSDAKYEYIRVSREACRADEIITVSGDSMEPTFHNGDDLFVEHTPNLRPGEIGIFVVAGEGYVKEYQEDGLHSHNSEYPVIRFNDGDEVRCVGKVLGVVGKDQYATNLELEIIEDIRREKAGWKE